MIEIEAYRNGSYPAINLPVDKVESISSADIVVLNSDVKVWDERGNGKISRFSKGQYFVVEDGVAYPFNTPLYEEDSEEGIKEQMLPETWEDVISIIESFGR